MLPFSPPDSNAGLYLGAYGPWLSIGDAFFFKGMKLVRLGERLQDNSSEPISKPWFKSISEFKKFEIVHVTVGRQRVCLYRTVVLYVYCIRRWGTYP